jgi:hypothetical protein
MRQTDLAYQREIDFTDEQMKAKISNRYGDPTKFQNITVPVVMPQVEAAVTYQSSVFLTGTPIFGFVADPQFEDEAQQLEAIIEENSTRGSWVEQLMLFFRDGFKYNLCAIEVGWGRKVTAALETDINYSTSQGRPKEVIWEGNTLRRLDPYNTFFDSRVAPVDIPAKGEFAGWVEIMSRIQLKKFIAELPDKIIPNVVAAFESGLGGGGAAESYYIPQINPDALILKNPRASVDWMAWAAVTATQQQINYKNVYEVTTLYARILPADFGLKVPAANTPQVWKFVIVNNQVVIYAERLTNAHGLIPILFGQPLEDGLAYQTKSLADNAQPFQAITSAMWNSVIAARRRAISDRGIYDPSRIAEHHINNDNPSAKIPVRPAAYGKSVQEAYYPIPFRDDQSGILMQESQGVLQFANMVSGQNQVRQGQFVKGNKTQREFDSVMSNANGRDQMTSMLLESQVFTPMKEIIRLNTLQYQAGITLYSPSKGKNVEIDPVALRKAVINFKVSDGLTPTDKLINSDTLQVAMQVIGSSPQISAGYNVAPLFSYFMKTQGAHLSPFEKSPAQLAYEQAVQQWQQTMQMVAQQLAHADPTTVQNVMKQLPKQPVPQDYGYDPSQAVGTGPSGIGQVTAAIASPDMQTRNINKVNNPYGTTGDSA